MFLVSNQLDAQFLLWYFYLNPLHVSSNHVLILRRTIVEEIVPQVGYLPELYEDARPEKHKKHEMFVSFFGYFSDNLIYCSNGHFPRLY
jgi:hypothetical protein